MNSFKITVKIEPTKIQARVRLNTDDTVIENPLENLVIQTNSDYPNQQQVRLTLSNHSQPSAANTRVTVKPRAVNLWKFICPWLN